MLRSYKDLGRYGMTTY